MRAVLRYLLTILFGTALGVGLAVHTVRAGALGSTVQIGPWATGRDFGAADASAKTRAVVAMRGLLAPPAREARYYTATTDDAGQPLDGRCTYTIEGGSLPAKWWSLTLYDKSGYLVGPGPYSIESAAVERPPVAEVGPTGELVYPQPDGEFWGARIAPNSRGDLSTAGLDRFELTLRLYLPADAARGDPPRAVLPTITRERC